MFLRVELDWGKAPVTPLNPVDIYEKHQAMYQTLPDL